MKNVQFYHIGQLEFKLNIKPRAYDNGGYSNKNE